MSLMVLGFVLFTQPTYALDLEKLAVRTAQRHNLDARLFVAIVRHESNFNPCAFNKKSLDFGLAQINVNTARAFKLDIKRLMEDPAYNLEAGALILKDFKKRYSKREPLTWMCRYNVGSGLLVGAKLKNCMKYIKAVQKYYKEDL